jgi:outer membrane murein-binding lipoprotein Lpp
MSRAGRALAAVLLVLPLVAGRPAAGQSCENPRYLPYAEFASADSAPQVAAKQAYNAAVERYNKAVYDYCVTWNRHSQLVDFYNGSSSPAERDRARSEAGPLRARLEILRREVATLASAVDQARHRAAQAGATIVR